jgi:hypothetical protein
VIDPAGRPGLTAAITGGALELVRTPGMGAPSVAARRVAAHHYCRISIREGKLRHTCNDQQDEECRDDYRRNEPAHNIIPPAQGITLHSFTLAIAKASRTSVRCSFGT